MPQMEGSAQCNKELEGHNEDPHSKKREREGRSRVGLIAEVMFRPSWRSQGKEP